MVKNYLSFTCILAMWAAAAVSSRVQSAPSSAELTGADCFTLIYNMMDCISFLSSGGDETTPDSACCLGLNTVLKLDADCICYALRNADSLGLDINMTKAEALPSECGVSAPSITNCNASTSPSPSASPANAPSSIAPPSNSPTLPPTTPPSAAAPSLAESPEASSPAQSPESLSPAVAPESPSPAVAPDAPSPAVAPDAPSSARGVPPSAAAEPAPASSADYTISSAFSAFLIAIVCNFLLFNA